MIVQAVAVAPADRWWASPLATVIAVLIAQLVVVTLFFASRRGDDKRRWHERRLETYSLLALAVREIMYLLASPRDEDNKAKLSEAMERAGVANFDIALLSTEEVRRAADALMDAATFHRRAVKPDEWNEHLAVLVDAKVAFDNEVRKELGIAKPRRRLVVEADGAFGLIGSSLAAAMEAVAKGFVDALGIRVTRR